MKKTILLIAVAAGIHLTRGYAQQLQPTSANHNKLTTVKNYLPLRDVSNRNWYDIPGGFVDKFFFNGINYRIDYDKNGLWLQTIRTYNENDLSQDVRAMVKGSYYDYNITLVEEIERPGYPLTYIIHLEGKSSWINLRVCNGEMDEWQKFNKSPK